MLSYHLSLSKYRPNISCNVFTCNLYFIEYRLLRFKNINAYYIIFPNYNIEFKLYWYMNIQMHNWMTASMNYIKKYIDHWTNILNTNQK